MSAVAIPLAEVGWKAQVALGTTGGRARVLARLSASIYLRAGAELIWLGRPGDVLHPRAMLTRSALPTEGETFTIDPGGARTWAPGAPAAGIGVARAVPALLAALRSGDGGLPAPRGLGALVVGRRPPFPLGSAVSPAAAIARACASDAPAAAMPPAERLLGLGPGLTPSGDDFVGGVLFARRLVGGAAWAAAGAALVDRARARTNAISQALLADLAGGHGHEPLHVLVEALGRGAGGEGAFDAIRRLDRLGHSSGWDVLAGMLVGLAGPAALFAVE